MSEKLSVVSLWVVSGGVSAVVVLIMSAQSYSGWPDGEKNNIGLEHCEEKKRI